MPVTDATVQRVLDDASAFIITTKNYLVQSHNKSQSTVTNKMIIGDPEKYYQMVDAICKLRLEHETS